MDRKIWHIILIIFFLSLPNNVMSQFFQNGALYGDSMGSHNPPDYWSVCNDDSSPELYIAFNKNDSVYFSLDSTSFLTLRAREDGTHEHIFTKLLQPLEKNHCYRFKGYFRHTFNASAGRNSLPVKIRIWGGRDSCLNELDGENFELLHSSSPITNFNWKQHEFVFIVKSNNYDYFYFEPYWDESIIDTGYYNGVIMLDNLEIEHIMSVSPPWEDTVLYYFSKDKLIKLDAEPGISYLWDPTYAVSAYDDQSVNLIQYIDTLLVSVQGNELCPASYRYIIEYNCDTVYKTKLRKESDIYLKDLPTVLEGSLGYGYHWYPTAGINNDTIQKPQFIGYNSHFDTLVYIDSISDFYGCNIAEKYNLIRNCDTINGLKSIKEPTTNYYRKGEVIKLDASEGESYEWSNTVNLNLDTLHKPLFIGYTDMFDDTLFYRVAITDGLNCKISEDFYIIRDCDTLHPEGSSYTMMDTIVKGLQDIKLSTQNTILQSWEPGEFLSCIECTDPIARPLYTISYKLVVHDEVMCILDEKYIIEVSSESSNVITPNNDGLNDRFIYSGIPPKTRILIFDKNGLLQYRSENYELPENWWDGKGPDGNKCEQGTYWYILEEGDSGKITKDFIYLKR